MNNEALTTIDILRSAFQAGAALSAPRVSLSPIGDVRRLEAALDHFGASCTTDHFIDPVPEAWGFATAQLLASVAGNEAGIEAKKAMDHLALLVARAIEHRSVRAEIERLEDSIDEALWRQEAQASHQNPRRRKNAKRIEEAQNALVIYINELQDRCVRHDVKPNTATLLWHEIQKDRDAARNADLEEELEL
jgi:hypothetical protein